MFLVKNGHTKVTLFLGSQLDILAIAALFFLTVNQLVVGSIPTVGAIESS
jgi:hypothetical protein